jgi:acyl-CoA hydrolase
VAVSAPPEEIEGVSSQHSAAPRRVRDSLVQMTEIVLPEDTNPEGSVFGGRVLALIDKCAAIVGLRHARSNVATVALDSVVFLSKVRVGNVLLLAGRINAAFGSSMEIEVSVHSENPLSGERKLTTTALVTIVAVDAAGKPTRAPALLAESEDERERVEQAAARRAARLAARG